MRVGIAFGVANQPHPTGIGLHVKFLVESIAAADPNTELLLYYPAGWTGRKRLQTALPSLPNLQPRPIPFPERWTDTRPNLWWKRWLPWFVKRDRVDLFHGPNHWVPFLDNIPVVVTIHDLAYLKMPVHGRGLDEYLARWTKQALERADRVIAVSKCTADDCRELGVPEHKLHVIYGAPQSPAPEAVDWSRGADVRQKLRLPEKLILFLGTLQPRKNVPMLVKAFHRLKQQADVPHHLVLAGGPGSSSAEVQQLIHELALGQQVHLTGYLDDWQIPHLLKLADVFVFPSLYEGFGLPVLEAMRYGTPVVATRVGALPEAVGDAGLLVEVDDPDALAEAILRVLTDHTQRDDLIARGFAHAQQFTWQRTAEQTLGVYAELTS